MTYKEAFAYIGYYASREKLAVEEYVVVNNRDQIRVVMFATDFDYHATAGQLIVRASINYRVKTLREDFIAIIPRLNERYKSEIAGGTFDFDLTAAQKGKFPYGINLMRTYSHAEIPLPRFYEEVEALLTAAIRWGNKYYIPLFDSLNKERRAH